MPGVESIEDAQHVGTLLLKKYVLFLSLLPFCFAFLFFFYSSSFFFFCAFVDVCTSGLYRGLQNNTSLENKKLWYVIDGKWGVM